MTKWVVRTLFIAALGVAVYWGRGVFFPGPERIIRKQLVNLAQAAAIRPNETPLAKAASARRIASFFTADAELILNVPGHSERAINGKDELLEVALAARAVLDRLDVEFVDVGVRVEENGASASVSLTAKGKVSGEKDFLAQELSMSWRKVAPRDWRIQRVETVRTFL